MSSLLKKLEQISIRFDQVSEQIVDPEIISDMKRYVNINREYKELGTIVEVYNRYRDVVDNIAANKEIIAAETDKEFVDMAKMELDELLSEKSKMDEEVKIMLIPKDEEDSKNVIIEIRAGAGGDEASIFAGDIFRMYTRYCEGRGWKTSVVDFSEGTNGGFKEIQLEINGDDVYGVLKFEAGVHRVQRVPQTETQGRVHTSAATVMVFPEAEEFDVQIEMKDVRVDYFCSSGPGGQSVNTTYSAVRLTHTPTGLVAQCQDQKSQHKNKEKAFKVLRSRLYDLELAKKQAEDAIKRGSMVTSGDRSAKIRTYNYSQGRVTDHRINLTLYDLGNIINGDIQKIIDELQLVNNTEKLKESGETF